MTKEILEGKESLNKEETKKDTGLELKNLKEDATQACINHLKLVVDKDYYKDIMEKNTSATIMSVQYLLKNKWYDVGEINWILVEKWKKTSKTTEAIKKFQKDYRMEKIDGLIGKDVINKLLSLYEIDRLKEEIKKKNHEYILFSNNSAS